MRTHGRPDTSFSATPDVFLGIREAERVGTEGDDRLHGTDSDDTFDLSQGGDDVAWGSLGNDSFYFGAAFTGADHVHGGEEVDTVLLDGDYSEGIRLHATNLVDVEQLSLADGSYVVKGVLAMSPFASVDATALNSSQSLHMNVSGSSPYLLVYSGEGDDFLDFSRYDTPDSLYGYDGDDTITGGGISSEMYGGNGDDTLTAVGSATNSLFSLSGGDGDDVLINRSGSLVEFHGDGGADLIKCNSVASIFEYGLATDSTIMSYDLIKGFTDGRFILSFDSNSLKPDDQHHFRISDAPGRPGDIVISYDSSIQQTIVNVFTDYDDTPDFAVHLTGFVELTIQDFTGR